MLCREFLERFSDYRDGLLSCEVRKAFEEHSASCCACGRYSAVVERGTQVLRNDDGVRVAGDFRARLQHSIYSLEEDRRRRSVPKSGTGAMAIAAIAAVAAVLLVSPELPVASRGVELAPIVARAPVSTGWDATIPVSPSASPVAESGVAPLQSAELWTQSNELLYRYSSLYSRHREPGVLRAGLR